MTKRKMIMSSEFVQFLNEVWPASDEDWYFDEFEAYDKLAKPVDGVYVPVFVDGEEVGVPVSDIDVYLSWQGRGEDPTDGEGKSLKKMFADWDRRRQFTRVSVDVPKDKIEDLREFLKTIGGKAQ